MTSSTSSLGGWGIGVQAAPSGKKKSCLKADLSDLETAHVSLNKSISPQQCLSVACTAPRHNSAVRHEERGSRHPLPQDTRSCPKASPHWHAMCVSRDASVTSITSVTYKPLHSLHISISRGRRRGQRADGSRVPRSPSLSFARWPTSQGPGCEGRRCFKFGPNDQI